MDYLSHLVLGLLMSCAALLLPGLVNMSAVSLSMKRGLRAGLWFCLGAAGVMLVQAYIAVAFAGFLGRHPAILTFLERISIFFFMLLSGLFLYLGMRPRAKQGEARRGHPLMIGSLMAVMNALTIPFYFTATTFMKVEGLVHLVSPYQWWLLIGAFVGALFMLVVYAFFARIIAQRSQRITQYIYLILSGFFLALAFVQLISLYYYP